VKRPGKRSSVFLLTSGVLAAAGLGFVFWSLALFGQLEDVVSQRALRRPSHFYSETLTLRPGLAMTPAGLAARLEQRGYRRSDAVPAAPSDPHIQDGDQGSRPGKPGGPLASAEGFFRQGGDSIDVVFKAFRFPDGRETAGAHRFLFRGERLDRLWAGDASLEEVLLEPVDLGSMAPGGVENSAWRKLADVPDVLKKALILSEDRRFYRHPGIDPVSLVRAVWVNARHRGVRQGGSTLTQQLVKNAFLSQERTLRRKFVEAWLSVAMELRYSKDEILEMYLNQIYLGQNVGRGIFGVEEAAQAFFGKPATELTLPESALLIGIIPSPNAYNPRVFPERALRRRERVLRRLEEAGAITKSEEMQAAVTPLALAPMRARGTGDYYLTWVRALLEKQIPGEYLDSQGLRVFTHMDLDLQKAGEAALAGQKLEGALVALDPYTGAVRALVGGRGYAGSPFNRATLAHRHPGSAFKPVLYAAALDEGKITLADFLKDAPLKVEENGRVWEPRNYDGQFRGTVTVRDAVARSMNLPAIDVLTRLGTDPVLAMAQRLGIASPLRPVPSLALGTSEVTPLEMTAAYAAFVNGGFAVKPLFVSWVTDAENRVLIENRPESRPAMKPETAALMTDILQDVVDIGTARAARKLGFTPPAAGKTGTSDNYMDAWFIGYTPQLLCGVWVGNDIPMPLGRGAAALAVPVWVKFMTAAQEPGPAPDFERNKALVEVSIDPANGRLARAGCVPQKKEFFLRGTEPKVFCDIHQGGLPGLFHRFREWMRK